MKPIKTTRAITILQISSPLWNIVACERGCALVEEVMLLFRTSHQNFLSGARRQPTYLGTYVSFFFFNRQPSFRCCYYAIIVIIAFDCNNSNPVIGSFFPLFHFSKVSCRNLRCLFLNVFIFWIFGSAKFSMVIFDIM